MKRLLDSIFIFLFCCFVWSCSSDKDEYTKIVTEWQGKEIILPQVMTDILTGDIINTDDADFTILTYIDSVGCTSCAMKLPLWNYFLNSLDSVCNGTEYNAVFVVNSKDETELSFLLKREKYYYPVVCDSLDFLNSTNHLPEAQMFRTFLLDKNNRVMAIGNPVFIPRIANLYKSIISGKKTFSSTGTQIISVDNPKADLGLIGIGDEQTSTFILKNESNENVRIRDIISSCQCTHASVSDSTIAAKGELPVKITFKEDSITGNFIRDILIYYHGFENPTILEISGTVSN